MNLLALDPGNRETGFCLIEMGTLRPMQFGKTENRELFAQIRSMTAAAAAIEVVQSYGMAVGRDVFETCEWIGRYEALLEWREISYVTVPRRDEKLHLCGDARAKDANIRRALIDRFAQTDLKNGKGTKAAPDWFYGFRADVWSAYAVGVTALETGLLDPTWD